MEYDDIYSIKKMDQEKQQYCPDPKIDKMY